MFSKTSTIFPGWPECRLRRPCDEVLHNVQYETCTRSAWTRPHQTSVQGLPGKQQEKEFWINQKRGYHSAIFVSQALINISLSDIRSKARSWRMWSLSFWICWGPGEKGFICFPIFNWTIKDTWRAQVFFLGLFSKHQWCRWNLAFSSRWTTSWNGSRSQSSAAIQMQSPGTVSLMTTARTPWSGTWNRLMPRRQEIRTFGSIATAGH